ncbi:MAG: pilus assembly FimT family protein [Planctomycetota bacterium]|jgi:prepilin-type N-terminal cleavage/methylation domain-containing protein
MNRYKNAPTRSCIHTLLCPRTRGFTLTELVVVIVMVSLFAFLTVTNLFGLLRRNTFKVQARQFVSTMQMAATAAAESDRRYEVIIDLTEQCYILRQITNPDLTQVMEEEIIVNNDFGNNCQVIYVLFDDLMETDEDHQIAKFRAGHAGWQYGGKVVLLDENEQAYSVVVNRMNRIVRLQKGDVELLMPKAKDEVFF